jgi:hypothetical protein
MIIILLIFQKSQKISRLIIRIFFKEISQKVKLKIEKLIIIILIIK